MEIKKYALRLISGLYLGLSLMSPFLYSNKMGIWQDNIDLEKLQYGGTHHLIFMLLLLIISVITYFFANSIKYATHNLLISQLNLSSEESKNEMDKISLIANLVTIFLYSLTIFERNFLFTLNDAFIKLIIVLIMILIGFTINHYLDKKFRYNELHYEMVHNIIAIPILIFNTIILMGLFSIIVFR